MNEFCSTRPKPWKILLSAARNLNNMALEWFDVSSGVRQGDSLSPMLFSIILNDLATEINI